MNVIETIDTKYLEQDYRNPIYIFHGSRVLAPILEPHQAVCKSGSHTNNQNALYGSSSFKVAVLFAFKDLRYSCKVGTGPDNLTMRIYDGVIPEDEFGYVYVCSANGFENRREDCQFTSYNNVVPIKVIKVYYKDFKECFVYEGDNHPRGM